MLAPASGDLVWSVCEKFISGHSSSLGSSSGVLAGLVAITPACAFVNPLASVIIGALSTLVCLWGARGFKKLIRV